MPDTTARRSPSATRTEQPPSLALVPADPDTASGHGGLPDPLPLVHALVRGLLEVLSGVREAEQLSRWFSEDAYRALVTRAGLAARARSARNTPAQRPHYGIRSVHLSSPADGVVEAAAVVAARARTRAVALRLEATERRWRVTAAALL
ncbi:Rv3235 family protein [Microbacterium enclense]|uniref:Rv3235 family protein n=1 Tax=Microbacterium enclense TaxID=993073 RepID=UPI0036DB7AFF